MLLLVAYFAGLGWQRWSEGRIAVRAREDAASQSAQLASLRRTNGELRVAVERAQQSVEAGALPVALPGAMPDSGAGPIPADRDRAARTRALLALVKSGEIGRPTYAAPSQYKVSTKVKKLAEVLGLAADETGVLYASADRVVSTLLAGALVTTDADQVTIEMRDSPEARAGFDEMRDTFRQVLGEDGHAVYEELGFRSALENSLNNLGLVGFTIIVSRIPGEEGKAPTYRFQRSGTAVSLPPLTTGFAPGIDEAVAKAKELRQRALAEVQAQAMSRSGPASSVGLNVPDRTALDSRLGPLSALLPAGF
jgi:hypothetical protein